MQPIMINNMKKYVFLFFMAFVTLAINAQKKTWELDTNHASLGFVVTHLGVSEVDGYFNNFDIKLSATDESFSDAVVELTAHVKSVDTDNRRRDDHLRSADFFDAAKYPKLTFKSKSVKKTGDKKFKVSGDLTMHGVTRQVDVNVVLNAVVDNTWSKQRVAGFRASSTIKRSDFGVGTGPAAATVGDEVKIVANLEFTRTLDNK